MTTDRHYTQPEVARAIVQRLLKYGDINPGDRILDPCVGKGAFSNAVRELPTDPEHPILVRTIDLDPDVEADIHNDFFLVPPRGRDWDLIVSNPPFTLAQAFVERSVGIVDPRGTVAFLLLLQFLGSVGRSGFFAEYPPTTIDVLRPRPSFAEDGSTDMREYALFRWCPQDFSCGGARMGWIDWEKPRKSRKVVAAIAAE